ncbi:MAG: YdcF family protein [Leptolyngbyaceae cyanobacterium bins.349]|nr:YdcF family protein [Leptolyngbyaceae cyanobacterium bins.349]
MFFFLSKLIPLFLYPLGLTCILLCVALIFLWRRPKLAAIPIALALLLLLVSSNAWVSDWLVRSLESQNLPPQELPKADAIVVLGGCTKPAYAPRPWVDVAEEGDRVLHAANLYKAGKAPKIILSGGRVDWEGDNPVPESEDMAILLKAMGIPETALIQEPTSRNTRENAVNVKQIVQSQKIGRMLLVTSAMHMPRSLKIFQKLGMDVVAAPTDFWVVAGEHLEFQATPQSLTLSLLPETERLRFTTRALKEYVGIGVYWLRGWL